MKSIRKGFTLVELMVVIVIIGILAALAIPRFLGATNKTKAAEFKPVLKQMTTLEEAYKQEREGYTTSKSGLAFDDPGNGQSRFSYDIPGASATTYQVQATLKVKLGDVPANSTATWDHDADKSGDAADTRGGTASLVDLANWH